MPNCEFIEIVLVQSNFIEIVLRHGCSPVNLLHFFKTPFPRNTPEWMLLYLWRKRMYYFWLLNQETS